MPKEDAFQHFLDAQQSVYENVLSELKQGKKLSHWMWFIFPQLSGLGFSAMSRRYSLASVEEADAYLSHPVLGGRLKECCRLLLASGESNPVSILGEVDALKLHSSMTLFHLAAPDCREFSDVLEIFCSGEKDQGTLELIATD